MLQHRLVNGSASNRKQQTAVKQTVDRPKTKSWHNHANHHRIHPYPSPSSSTIVECPLPYDDHQWMKPSRKTFDETPELELICHEDILSDAQLQNYPSQAYDPSAPLPLPAVRKRTAVVKKLTAPDVDILHDPDEDFVPSESDDDDDDENYLPEHDRRPYNRTSQTNGHVSRGRGRGARGHVTSTNIRVPPSTHFVRPQPELTSHSRSPVYSTSSTVAGHRHRNGDSLELELERTYAAALTRYYGTRHGQSMNSTDYGDFRIKCSVCGEQSLNNMLFIAHLCSHFEDDLNYVSPFDKAHRRCSVCQDEFSTPFQTLLHKDQEHMMELHDFCCRICQQTYSSLVDLFTHLNQTHVGLDMPYHCDRCSYRTSMHEDMAHHIRQMHKGTQYFFCPYCFQSVLLPSISYTNVLDSTPAFRHVILHFDRIENSNSKQQQRRIESLFKYCNRCVLHVKSIREHGQYHHPSSVGMDEEKTIDEENHLGDSKRNTCRAINDNMYHYRFYPPKFDRSKQLPMATIRRRPTMLSHYEQVNAHNNNRWYARR